MYELSELVDKQLELEKQLGVEIEKFKNVIDNCVLAFEKDTGVCLKEINPLLFLSTISVEIDFVKTKERMRNMKVEK
jgi:hypothetical protein